MKKIKSIIPIMVIALLSTTTTKAQHHKDQKNGKPERFYKPGSEKFKTMKIAHISEKLNLTSKEAEVFWPVYNEYEAKKLSIRKEHKKTKSANSKNTEVSDAEIEKRLNQRIEKKQKELDLEKEYLTKFKTLLPIKKVAKLYKAETSFKKDLLRRMKNTPPPPTPQPNK